MDEAKHKAAQSILCGFFPKTNCPSHSKLFSKKFPTSSIEVTGLLNFEIEIPKEDAGWSKILGGDLYESPVHIGQETSVSIFQTMQIHLNTKFGLDSIFLLKNQAEGPAGRISGSSCSTTSESLGTCLETTLTSSSSRQSCSSSVPADSTTIEVAKTKYPRLKKDIISSLRPESICETCLEGSSNTTQTSSSSTQSFSSSVPANSTSIEVPKKKYLGFKKDIISRFKASSYSA